MTRERLDSLLYEKKKKLRNSKFEYCDYFDEYLEFVENNPCSTIDDFLDIDIWELFIYLYQITDPITSLEENKETIYNFRSIFRDDDDEDEKLFLGLLFIFERLRRDGNIDEVIDFLEETNVIKGILKLNKIDFNGDTELRNIVIDTKQVFSKYLPSICAFFRLYSRDFDSLEDIIELVIDQIELRKAKEYNEDFNKSRLEGLNNREMKRFFAPSSNSKFYNDLCDTKRIFAKIDKIKNLVEEQTKMSEKHDKNIKKEIAGYDRAIVLLDEALKQNEVRNAKEIIKNVKDEDLKRAFLKVIYVKNMLYYEQLEKEYNRLNQNGSSNYASILQNYNISFTEQDLKEIVRKNELSDVEKIIKIAIKLDLSINKVELLKHTSLDKITKIKSLVDDGYISKKYLDNNETFMWDESDSLRIYEENIFCLDKYNLNPGMFISITDIIINSFDNFSFNLGVLNDYGLLKNLKNVKNLSFLGDSDLTYKIDKFLELGYERFLDTDLGILNLSNLKRLDMLKFLNMPVSDVSSMYKVLSNQKFIVDDNKIDEYLPNVVELSGKKDIYSVNFSDYKSTNRVYSIGGSLFSINKIRKALERGNSLYDTLFMNRNFSEEEYDNILKALGCYTTTK